MSTPGPWRWADWSAYFGTIENPDRRTTLEHNLRFGDTDEPVLRSRDDNPTRILETDDEINSADKRLIAAAPDLASALSDMLDMFGGNMDSEDYERFRALAKLASQKE